MKDKASVSHDESMARELRENPDFAAEYLRAAMEDEADPRVLLLALRRVAEARGLARVAKTAGIERESLYRALSPRGTPRFSTLVAVAKAMGLRLTFESGSTRGRSRSRSSLTASSRYQLERRLSGKPRRTEP